MCPYTTESRSFRCFSHVNFFPTDFTFCSLSHSQLNLPTRYAVSCSWREFCPHLFQTAWKHSNCATPKARTRTGLEPQDELVTMVGELLLFVKEDWWKVKNPLGTKTYHIPDCFPHQMERMLQFHFLPQTNHSMHVYTIITPTHPSMTKMKNSTRYTHFFPLKGRTNHT